jgi:hypothetical protein
MGFGRFSFAMSSNINTIAYFSNVFYDCKKLILYGSQIPVVPPQGERGSLKNMGKR